MVVNHWKSNLPSPSATAPLRAEASRKLGEFVRGSASYLSEAVLLIGDFNCEPHAPPFRHSPLVPADGIRLRAVREHSLLLNHNRRLAYLYNPTWRYLGEPQASGTPPGPGPKHPLGTFCRSPQTDDEWLMWDQVMLTRPLLAGPIAHLLGERVSIVRPVNDCSDHCGIGLALRLTQPQGGAP